MVSLPLIGAIVTAIVQVNSFSQNNQSALVRVQNNTYNSTLLIERITLMERNARQYQALLDTSYKERYQEHRKEVLNLFDQLKNTNEDIRFQTRLNSAIEIESISHQFVLPAEQSTVDTLSDSTNIDDENGHLTGLESSFSALRDEALAIVLEHHAKAQQLSNAMPEEAASLQNMLVGQAIWVIPLSSALALLFAIFIAKPLRQINQGIRSLGHGSLTRPIRVTGSSELEELGRQLNFLRLRLIEFEAQKVQFLRNVSHELKTPLTSIREASELLFNANVEEFESDGRIIAPILLDNSIRLQKMIEELLVFGADNDLTNKQIREPIQLGQLIKDASEKQRMPVKTHSINLMVNVCNIEVIGNAKRLGIIVDNLLSNAIKYTPNDGCIYMDLSVDDGIAILDIRDGGKGVSSTDQPHLFDWFYTGEKPEGAIMLGTGMGLAISQEYAAQHGGKIELVAGDRNSAEAITAKSTEKNIHKQAAGAHFRLCLPINNLNSNNSNHSTINLAMSGVDQ